MESDSVVVEYSSVRTSVERILIDAGYSVTRARNAEEAIRLARDTHFDVIVVADHQVEHSNASYTRPMA